MSREAIAVVGMGMIVLVVVVASVLMVVEVRVWQQMGSYLQRCSHVFIGAVVGEEAGGVRGLQSRVHWNYTWRASGGVYSRGCMRGRRIKKHQVSFGERRRARARRSSIAWVRGRRLLYFSRFCV